MKKATLFESAADDCQDVWGNGSIQYSRTVQAHVQQGNFVVQAYPNPANDLLTFRTSGKPGENASITLRDISGRELRRVLLGSAREVSLVGLPAGVYWLYYRDSLYSDCIRVLKN